MSARRPTLKETADALGVSVSTVSNAFNRPDQLSRSLRERVLAEAARRGLSAPDRAARSLRRGRSVALGVIYTDRLSYAFSDPGAVLVLQGITQTCEQAELELVLIPRTSVASAEATSVGRSIVDGLIVYSVADDDPVLAAALTQGLPTVVVDQPRAAGPPWIGIDDEQGSRAVCEHLVGLGHRRLAVISAELDRGRVGGLANPARQASSTFSSTVARLRGYRRAVEGAGLDWSTVLVFEAVENSERQGHAAALMLLKDRPRPTALLAMTDQLAVGACQAARGLGLAIPRDLSVVGFDDIPAAAQHQPPLTTVHQPHHEKGRLAAGLVLELVAGQEPVAHRQELPTALRVRSSAAPPPNR